MSEAAPKPMSFEHLGLEQGGGPAEIDRGNSKMRLLAVAVALVLLLRVLIFFLPRRGDQPPAGTPEPDRDTTSVVPDGPWPVYLDLAGNRTFRRENLTERR